MRSDEIVAIAETIKILNDDDALELFKKTLPSPSLLQTRVGMQQVRVQALKAIAGSRGRRDPRLDFIALALRGKKVSFAKVIAMIDDMIALLAKEQTDDDNKKEYCAESLDVAEDKLKELEHTIGNLEKDIADGEAAVATLTEEIAALIQGIKDLDKAVAEATATRKEENEEYTETMAADTAAEQLLQLAKNRLNKFYNPKLYKPPQKGEESSGVIAMIDLLIKDLATEMTTITAEEDNAQKAYAKLMVDSAEKRTADTKLIAEKEATKADLEVELENMGAEKADAAKEAMATMKYLESLHAECDWLIKNFDLRKEARAGEVDALKKAKAVLSGADYSFVQTGIRPSPHRS